MTKKEKKLKRIENVAKYQRPLLKDISERYDININFTACLSCGFIISVGGTTVGCFYCEACTRDGFGSSGSSGVSGLGVKRKLNSGEEE